MTDEQQPDVDAEMSAPVPPPVPPPPLSKADKLEAKAARLREAELARREADLMSEARVVQRMAGWGIAAIAVLLVLLAASLGALGYEASSKSDLQAKYDKAADSVRLDALRASALKTATTVATSFGTYDYQTLAADFARTRAYLTPSFAADFSKLTTTLGSLITQDKGQIVGTVQGAGVESVTDTTAVVLVFLDQKVTTAESSTPRLDHNRVRLTLTLQPNKTWLVSKLDLL